MAKRVSTSKQEGGGGYSFEDKVSASFLVKMLTAEPLLEANAGVIDAVRFQKRVDGWLLSDVVLSLTAADNTKSSAAISIKSSAQITGQAVSQDFVKTVWEQLLLSENNPFEITRDYLVLAAAPADVNVSTSWHSLLRKALVADPVAFHDRISVPFYANDTERNLFTSLHCPISIDASKTPSDTTKLLTRLRYLQFDFENTPSENENTQINALRSLLCSGDLNEAQSLWTHLTRIAREYATSGGDLPRQQLADRLRTTFSLREYPDYASDWQRITDDFNSRTQNLRDKLGGFLALDREESRGINQDASVVALIGASGSGKTTLAKQCATNAPDTGHRVWLTAQVLNAARPNTILGDLRLSHNFTTLLADAQIQCGTVVIDGLERLNHDGIVTFAGILKATRVTDHASPWRLIVTCTFERWESILRATQIEHGESLNVQVTQVGFDITKHHKAVAQAFPNIVRLLQRPHLYHLLNNLKVLDIVASNASNSTNAEAWIGETDIINWYWSQVVMGTENRAAVSRFLQKLACIEADELITDVPFSEFDSDECRLSQELESNGIVVIRNERFQFTHDLLGDWARSRFLLSHEEEAVSTIRARAGNPRWHKAIRLFGLRLLEDDAHETDHWCRLLEELNGNQTHTTEGDLVLESAVFASNAHERLEQVWALLLEKHGVLLQRLLSRFLHVATLPDPLYVDDSASASLAAHHRYPFWPLWMPVLKSLHMHRAEIIPLAIDQVTQIASLWLECSEDGWLHRNDAAQILLDSADHIIKQINSEATFADVDHAVPVFIRLLAAAPVRPNEVEELALLLSERRDHSAFEEPEEEDDEDDASEIYSGKLQEPWPEGPRRRVNHQVQEAFLDSSSPLTHLFRVKPAATVECLLALLIREPLRRSPHAEMYYGGITEFFDFEHEHEWRPGMFFHGPFLRFLQLDPQYGVQAIVSLVNFATRRLLEKRQELKAKPLTVAVGGHDRHYFGDSEAYFWYRDTVNAEGVLSSALMALEKWLYTRVDENSPIDDTITQILSTTESTALLGVLVSVGRRSLKLFKTQLRELIPCWELMAWEETYRLQRMESLLGMTMTQWVRWGERIWDIVRDWHTLPHREVTLLDTLLRQFLIDSEMRAYLKEAHLNWERQLAALAGTESATFLHKFVLGFDEHNWREKRTEQGIEFEYIESEETRTRLAPQREASSLKVELLGFPHSCRQIIDDKRILTDEELSVFWETLQRLADQPSVDSEQANHVAAAVCGGIAVLTLSHYQWLKEHPDRENWCWDKVSQILDNPPPYRSLNIAESISNYHWNNFAALIFPLLLSEEPNAPGIRAYSADFALAYNYSVVEDFMSSAFNHRHALGADFDRLLHLLLLSSGLREVHIVTHGGNSIWGTPDVPFDLGASYDKLTDQFVDGTLSSTLPSLNSIAISSNTQILTMVRQQAQVRGSEWTDEIEQSISKRIMRARGFDAGLLRAALAWISEIEPEADQVRRNKWLNLLEDFLHAYLRPLGGEAEAVEDDHSHSSFYHQPTEYERWFFNILATTIPTLRANEQPQRLWQPILTLGIHRLHWVDSFLSAFFLRGSRIESGEETFFREWKAMMEYAYANESWWKSEVRTHTRREELYLQLLGIWHGEFMLKDVRHIDRVTAVKQQMDKWIDKLLPNPDIVTNYALFLTAPSAANHLRDGMVRLSNASTRFRESHWRDFYHLDSNLLRLLEHDWNVNANTLRRDSEARRHFTSLLKLLADRQIPGALELQDRIAGN